MKTQVSLHPDRLRLAMTGAGETQRIEVLAGSYSGNPTLNRWLFSQVGLLHLVAPHLPETIRTDFPVFLQTRHLIDRMYRFEGREGPEFVSPFPNALPFRPPHTSARRAVVEYSGGKDSMWNLVRAQERYGPKNVLAVHIKGLAKSVGAGEWRASLEQSRRFGFPLHVVEISKSSAESGANVLRSAKIFDAGLVAPIAIAVGARHIVTEEPGGPCYTGSRESMTDLNDYFFHHSRLPLRVVWWNRPRRLGVVRDLIRRRPDWLPHVHNCFSRPNYKDNIHRSWGRRTPTFRPFPNACGSCVKCRLTRLGWLLDGPHRASRRDAAYFLKTCEEWARKKQSTHSDFIGGSFSRYLREAKRRYGLTR